MRLGGFLRRISHSLLLGYIFVYWSEMIFWSFWRPETTLIGYILAWVLYSFIAYVVLIVAEHYRVKTTAAYLLLGALFGWIDEGLFAMTLFGSGALPFPITISWTALAWHMLLSLGVGWLLTQRALSSSTKQTLLLALGTGLFWGFWASAWYLETPPVITSPPTFFLFAFLTTCLFAAAHLLLPHFAAKPFHATRAEKILVVLLMLAFFGFITVPTVPLAAIVLPALTLILWLPLRRNRARESSAIPHALQKIPTLRAGILVLIIPVTATFFYVALPGLSTFFPANLLVLIVSSVLGVVVFCVSWVKVWRGNFKH